MAARTSASLVDGASRTTASACNNSPPALQSRSSSSAVLFVGGSPAHVRRSGPGAKSLRGVSHWISLLQSGDPHAVEPLWERYFHRLIGLARVKLEGQPRRAADEEDVALSAFASFCRAAEGGRFPRLSDRHDLWRLLATPPQRKGHNLGRDERRQQRSGGR